MYSKIDQIALQLDSVTIKHFPNIPQDILVDYFDTMIDALQNGEVKIEDITDEKIIKSISKLYSEPNKITIQQAETIIKDKMTGGTQNQRNDTLKKVKQWFVDNDCIATEEQIKHKTFIIHNDSKTSGRALDQRYQD